MGELNEFRQKSWGFCSEKSIHKQHVACAADVESQEHRLSIWADTAGGYDLKSTDMALLVPNSRRGASRHERVVAAVFACSFSAFVTLLALIGEAKFWRQHAAERSGESRIC